jgi:hypothetical protein
LQSVRVREPQKKELLTPRRVSIPAGEQGYITFPFRVEQVKPQHNVRFTISVIQSGRNDLDIGFSVVDDENYHKWLARQPSSAFLIAHRFKYGTMIFVPSTAGQFYAILDNRYSVFTAKEVQFEISEWWLEEKEVKLAIPEESAEKTEKPKITLWQRLLNRVRYSRTLHVIGLLVIVQLFCFLLAVAIAHLFNYSLGIKFEDTMGYIATAIGGSAVAVSVYLYFAMTGKPLPIVSGM